MSAVVEGAVSRDWQFFRDSVRRKTRNRTCRLPGPWRHRCAQDDSDRDPRHRFQGKAG